MNEQKQLSIMEFSKLTGIKRENLRFYDQIGLLCPESRGDNNYRYYSHHQLSSAYLISGLRQMDVGIEEIKQYSTQRTPEKSLALLAQQDARIEAKILRLRETQHIMKLYSDMVKEALAHEENTLFLIEKEQEPIFLCPPVSLHMSYDERETLSYSYAEEKGINLGYPLGVRIPHQCLTPDAALNELQYYFKVKTQSNGEKPSGLYAVAYGQYPPWHSAPLYVRLLDFIHEQGLYICGEAYEEYPLSDISVQTFECYCIRVEIQVSYEVQSV